jgi:hypothetical protein
MRILIGTVLASATALVALAAADDPAPLFKPVTPSKAAVRVRIPVIEQRGTAMHFEALVPKAKGKTGETVEITAALEVIPGKSFVPANVWQNWGYEVPQNKMVTLPELTVSGLQVAPKSNKGFDVTARFTDIRLEVIEPSSEAEKVAGADLYLRLADLTRPADRLFEPRLFFQDKFLDLSLPTALVKHPGTGEDAPAEPRPGTDADRVAFGSTLINRQAPVFPYASVNGLALYKLPDGKVEPVSVGVASTTDTSSGAWMTMGMARGCNVQLDADEVPGNVATVKTKLAKGVVKELRLSGATGPGLKTPRDLVITDLQVYVDKNDSGHFLYLGPRFLETYYKDAVFSCGPDGTWQLRGRARSELLKDIKTRPKM